MAFWSGEKLTKAGSAIVDPFNEDSIDCNAYTLHMGRQYYRTAHEVDSGNEVRTKVGLRTDEPFAIPPGQFAFLLTSEIVKIPNDAMALISIKAKVKFQGLINISGFHVDPGYKGRLIFAVFNAGPAPIHLQQGMPLFLIWYADLDQVSAKVRADGNQYTEITNDLIKGMNREILSLQSLSGEIRNIKIEVDVQSRLFKWAIGISSAFAGAVVVGMALVLLRVFVFTPVPAAPTTSEIERAIVDSGGNAVTEKEPSGQAAPTRNQAQ